MYVVQHLGVVQVHNDWLREVQEALQVGPHATPPPHAPLAPLRCVDATVVACVTLLMLWRCGGHALPLHLKGDAKPRRRASPGDGMHVVASDSIGTTTGAIVCPNKSSGHLLLVHVRVCFLGKACACCCGVGGGGNQKRMGIRIRK